MTNDDTMSNTSSIAPAQKLALCADILRDCASVGSHFAANMYEQDRWRRVQDVTLELLALASARSLEELEPLRAKLFVRPSPFSIGDGAVIDDAGKILLIRRADNGLWAMPGGGLEVGETPAQGVVREVLEETGVTCEPITLIGVYDSRLCGTPSFYHLYQISFLCRPLPNVEVVGTPSHAHETKEMNWFAEHALPDDLDPSHATRILEAFRVWHGDTQAFFDRQL